MKRYLTIFAATLFLFPFGSAVYLLVSESNNQINFTEKERVGIRYHKALFQTLLTLQTYRGRTFISENSGIDSQEIDVLKEDVLKSIESVDALIQDARILNLLEAWNNTKELILNSFERVEGERPNDHFVRQTSGVEEIMYLMRETANNSNLILDPNIQTYYIMNVITNILPDTVKNLGIIRGRAAGDLAGGPLKISDEQELLKSKGKLQELEKNYLYSISVISKSDPEKIYSQMENELGVIGKLEEILELFQRVVDHEVVNLTSRQFFEKITFEIKVLETVYNRFSKNLDGHLVERANSQKSYRNQLLLTLLAALAIAITIIYFTRKNIVNQKELDSAVRTKAILRTIADGIITINSEGFIEGCNEAAEDIFGYKETEIIGLEIHKHLGLDVEKITDIDETEVKRKDGSIFTADVSVNTFESENGRMLVCSIRDITKRKAAEQEVQILTKLNQAVFDTAPVLMGVMDNDFKFKSMNAYAHKTLGYEEADFDGTQTPYLLHKDEELEDRAKELSEELGRNFMSSEVLLTKMEIGEFEAREWTYVKKDGSTFPVILSFVPLKDDGGEQFGILGVALDITNLKKAEVEREGLIDELTYSNEELERFAYVCSHDLQEPLRMISSFSEILQNHIGEALEGDEKGKKYFKFITEGAVHAQDLITGILAYSSINNNVVNLEEFSTKELVELVKRNILLQLDEGKGTITYDELPNLTGNKTQIIQLFQNLINNGIKYQKTDTNPSIHIGVEDAKEYWKFSIRDNGIGMKEHHLNKIFEVFKRLHRKNEYAGTGIGLSICKKIVERHGGEIWAESEYGKGSVFFFTLLKSATK